MPNALFVTGLNGSPTSGPRILKILQSWGYYVKFVRYSDFSSWKYRGFDLYAGHSMGAMVLQYSFIPTSKLHLWGAPYRFRGTHHEGFFKGHGY